MQQSSAPIFQVLVVAILLLVLSVTLLVGWRENLMPRHLSSGISCSTHSLFDKPCFLLGILYFYPFCFNLLLLAGDQGGG
jgi:hypothetical protein